jgi:MFS family permease
VKGLHRNVYLLSLSAALAMSCNTLIIATAALVGYDLASDKSFATLPLALQFVATMCTSIPAALLMQRIGRKPAFLLATLAGAAGGVLATLAILGQDFWLFVAANICVGIFNGFANYFRFTAADSVGLAQKSRAVSLVMTGGLLAAFLGPNLARLSRDWLASAEFAGGYLVSVLLYMLVFCLLSGLRIGDPPGVGGTVVDSARPLRQILQQPRFLVALLCGTLGYCVMTFVMTATPLSMQDHAFHFNASSTVIQWHVVAMFAPCFFTGSLIARFGVGTIMASGALFGLASVATNLSGSGFGQYLAGLILLGLSWNFLFVGATTLLTESYQPAEKNKAQALNDFIVFTLVALASLSAGTLQNRYGWQVVNLSVIPLLLLAMASALWLVVQDKCKTAVGGIHV